MSVLIEARGLCKQFITGDVVINALDHVDFTVEDGELIVILGPSGSGKSTMVNIIGGIDMMTSGELYYNDLAIHEMNMTQLTKYRRDHVSYIFQFYNLMPNLTALENIDLAGQLSLDPIDPAVLLDKVGLSDRKNNYPSRMSGGQQQRVAIARAICKNPDLLLCDEPTGALDTKTGVDILNLLLEFNKEYRKTVVIITHNANIAQIADRVFFFRDGRLEKIEVNEHPLAPDEVQW